MNYVSIVAQITINKYPKSNKSQSHAEARGADAWDRGRPVRKTLGPRTSHPPSADETSAPPCCGLDRFGYNSAG